MGNRHGQKVQTVVSFALIGLMAIGAGCTFGRGTVATTPSASQTQAVRMAAAKAADTAKLSMDMLDRVGVELNTTGLPAADKDKLDCAIAKANGVSGASSATLTRVCGAVPDRAVAPTTKALGAIQAAGACPGLRSSITALSDVIRPVYQQLQASGNQSLRMAGIMIETTVSLLVSGGMSCQ